MKDIVPELQQKIEYDLKKRLKKSSELKELLEKVEAETGTYKDAQKYAIEVGKILSETFLDNLSSEILPDGKMYFNIAERITGPLIKDAYKKVSDYANKVQAGINKKAGIGIKPIEHKINEDRVKGIIDIVSGKEKFDDIAYMLKEPVINICQAAVDETVKANAEFHYKAGIESKIIRTAHKPCKWCESVAGVYNYPDVPKDVYRRHQNCRCVVEYVPRNGKRQGVHSKQIYESHSEAMKNERRYLDKVDKMSAEERKEARNARAREARRNRYSDQEWVRRITLRDEIANKKEARKTIGLENSLKKDSAGLSAKAINQLATKHEPPKFVKKIDFANATEREKVLKDFEKDAINFKRETACVILQNGEVYKCYGTSTSVFPDSDLGDKIKGSIISHNHPIDETEHSFSNQDITLFNELV